MAETTASPGMEEVAQSLVDPTVAPETEGVIAEGEASASPLPTSPPETTPGSLASYHPGNGPTPEVTFETEEITVTDQDVLFGRGGLTNRHIGNLRYRDIISIHRQDYVRAQKTEKPQVARRIVAAIRTGSGPGRFLKRGDDGKWLAVSDQEAAWKASQALREKSRWSSMKQGDEQQQASPSVEKITTDSTTTTRVDSKKRVEPKRKKFKVEAPVPRQLLGAVPAVFPWTDLSQIAIPPDVNLGNTKQFGAVTGADYVLPPTMNTNSSDIFPKNEDILFGRGGRTNHHPGNKRLRQIVNQYRDTYRQAKKLDKPNVSKLIVSALQSAIPPSRFLRMNEETALWEDVGDKRAAEKVSQRLREKDRGDENRLMIVGETVPAGTATQEAPKNAMSVTASHEAFQRVTEETQMA